MLHRIELLRRSDAGQWLTQQQGGVSCVEAATMIAALADGIDYVHSHGVLHRDIKPSNVLLEPRSNELNNVPPFHMRLSAYTPRLTDFGLAKLLEREDSETRSGMLLGTPPYMAPEQANGLATETSARTDVYGLGVLLYELLHRASTVSRHK